MISERTIYLLRHGESETNRQRIFAGRKLNPALTSEGREMVKLQSRRIAVLGVKEIFSSPMLRARQTAEIVAKQCELAVNYSDDLEEVDVGSLNGLSLDDPKHYAVYTCAVKQWETGHSEYAIPGGESLQQVRERFDRMLALILDGITPSSILLVGHGVLWMTVLWMYCHLPGEPMDKYYMGRAHLTEILLKENQMTLIKFNIAPNDLVVNS